MQPGFAVPRSIDFFCNTHQPKSLSVEVQVVVETSIFITVEHVFFQAGWQDIILNTAKKWTHELLENYGLMKPTFQHIHINLSSHVNQLGWVQGSPNRSKKNKESRLWIQHEVGPDFITNKVPNRKKVGKRCHPFFWSNNWNRPVFQWIDLKLSFSTCFFNTTKINKTHETKTTNF